VAEISWIERAYTNFIYRDLCHVFSGGLIICVFEYILWGEIFLPEVFSLEAIGFLLFSFFIGLGIVGRSPFIMSIIVRLFGLSLSQINFSSELLLKQEIIDKYDARIIDELERMSFLTLIGRTIGISSLISGIFMIGIGLIQTLFKLKDVTFEYFTIAILLVLFGSIMVYDYFSWRGFYINNLNKFIEKIDVKNIDSFEEERIEQKTTEHQP